MSSLKITHTNLISHRTETRDYYPNEAPEVDSLIMQATLTLHLVTSNHNPKSNKWDYQFELSVGRRLLDELDMVKEVLDPSIKPAFVMMNSYEMQVTASHEINFETDQYDVINILANHVNDDVNQMFSAAMRTLNITC
ncbi:hypothetical protein ACP3V3_19635 [Vibrio sp. PNB22_3_1]